MIALGRWLFIESGGYTAGKNFVRFASDLNYLVQSSAEDESGLLPAPNGFSYIWLATLLCVAVICTIGLWGFIRWNKWAWLFAVLLSVAHILLLVSRLTLFQMGYTTEIRLLGLFPFVLGLPVLLWLFYPPVRDRFGVVLQPKGSLLK